MSNELINALESRVTTAVDTIEGLRSENRVLKEERQRLEEQLRQLLLKIEGVDENHPEPTSSFSNPEPEDNRGAPMEGPGMGMNRTAPEF